jgi:hypothetical protein
MTPREFYKCKSRDEIAAVAKAANTTFHNFQQIAIANGSVGKDLAARLAIHSNGAMSELEILYPERFKSE